MQKSVEHQVWSDGDDEEDEEKRENCLVAVNMEFAESVKVQGVRKPITEKNYCFMVTNKNPEGKSIIDQVRILLELNNYDESLSAPNFKHLEMTLADVLTDYRASVADRGIVQQELYTLRERFEDKRLKVIKLEKELVLERDCKIVLENEQSVLISQRDVAREDNVRLNVLLDNIYKSKSTFENIDIIGNTYNWGWSKGCALGNENFPHFTPPPTKEKLKHTQVPGHYAPEDCTDDSCASETCTITPSTSVHKLNSNCVVEEEIPVASSSKSSFITDFQTVGNILPVKIDTSNTSNSFVNTSPNSFENNSLSPLVNNDDFLSNYVNDFVNDAKDYFDKNITVHNTSENKIASTFVTSSVNDTFKKIVITCPPLLTQDHVLKSVPTIQTNSNSDNCLKSSMSQKKSRKKKKYPKPRLNCYDVMSPKHEARTAETLENLARALKNLSAPRHSQAYMYAPFRPKVQKKVSNVPTKVTTDMTVQHVNTDTSSVSTPEISTINVSVPISLSNAEQSSACSSKSIFDECPNSQYTAAEYGLPTDLDSSSDDGESLGTTEDSSSVSVINDNVSVEPSTSATIIRYRCVINTTDCSFYYEPISPTPSSIIKKCTRKSKPKPKGITKIKESKTVWIPKLTV